MGLIIHSFFFLKYIRGCESNFYLIIFSFHNFYLVCLCSIWNKPFVEHTYAAIDLCALLIIKVLTKTNICFFMNGSHNTKF